MLSKFRLRRKRIEHAAWRYEYVVLFKGGGLGGIKARGVGKQILTDAKIHLAGHWFEILTIHKGPEEAAEAKGGMRLVRGAKIFFKGTHGPSATSEIAEVFKRI
ncbi:hypothetical protein CMO92_04795 [Candidatus Woesearchaeota archaeon]|nr:hypothetical protein [Candidatus Woesearchaeota archaeon]